MKNTILPIVALTGLLITQGVSADPAFEAVRACANAYESTQCTAQYLASIDQTDNVFNASNQSFNGLISLAETQANTPNIEESWDIGYQLYKENRFDEAEPFLEASCELEHSKACTILGVMYENYSDVENSLEIASSAYLAGCKYGDMQGCTSLATILIQNPNSASEDYTAAQMLLTHSCNSGDGRGCNNLAVLLTLADSDDTVIRNLYEKACSLNYQNACEHIR